LPALESCPKELGHQARPQRPPRQQLIYGSSSSPETSALYCVTIASCRYRSTIMHLMEAVTAPPNPVSDFVDFRVAPSRYRHWKMSFEDRVATLAMDVQEDAGIRPGYKLKLNSYDLGVDIELHNALQQIRFEHPEVATVVITSAKPRVFCSGANIYMLGLSNHAWKVNFCKFTNETRNGIEDSSAHSRLKFIAACNGSTAGGGYELA